MMRWLWWWWWTRSILRWIWGFWGQFWTYL